MEAHVVDLEARHRSVLDHAFPGLPFEAQQLMYLLALYLHLTDTDYIVATLAAAVAKERADFDPLWLMLVAPSSSGKGEALRLLAGVQEAVINDVTVPGLLGKGDTGMLVSLRGENALAVITDFSTLLGDPRVSGASKAEVFNALRDVYDGAFSRLIHPVELHWRGRLSLVAACTPAIDSYSAHSDALGTRWLYFRMKERDESTKREVAKMAMQRSDLHRRRDDAREVATQLILNARQRVCDVELPADLDDAVCDIATMVTYGRASVPRDYRREVDGVVTVEDPGRIVNQLRLLALGLVALQIDGEVVRRIVRRAAMSSMPQARARVLNALLAAEEPISEYAVAKRADLHIKVAGVALEDWSLVDFTEESEDTGQKGRIARFWTLTDRGRSMGKAGID